MKSLLLLIFCGALSVAAYGQTLMFVSIEANGELITEGEATEFAQIDLQEYASALSYGWSGQLVLDAGGPLPTSGKSYGPLRIVKPLARSSVLLRKALDQNQQIDLILRVFSPPLQDGTTPEIYRIDLTGGRVAAIRPFSEGTTGQYLEEVRFAWQAIEFTDVQTGTSHLIQFPIQP